jgi:hypothetical protein
MLDCQTVVTSESNSSVHQQIVGCCSSGRPLLFLSAQRYGPTPFSRQQQTTVYPSCSSARRHATRSTRTSHERGRPRSSNVVRRGVPPGTTHASQIASISENDLILRSQILAWMSSDLSVPASLSRLSMRCSISFVCAPTPAPAASVAVSPMNCIVWTGENSSEAALPIVMFVQSLIHSAAAETRRIDKLESIAALE